MGRLDRFKVWYDDEGIIAIPKAIFITFVYLTPLYGLLGKLLNESTHEKLIRAPRLGYWPHIEEPRTFNEKILYRKLYTDKEIYTLVSDKWRVRDYVREKVGDEILNEVYYVTEEPETIPFADLPERFVIKVNNGCGSNIIIQNKSNRNRDELISQCEEWMSTPHGVRQREYWYKHIQPKTIVERFIESDTQEVPRDYKFFVFNGDVKYIEVDFDRFSGHTRRFYDTDWSSYEFKNEYPLGDEVEEPKNLDEMISIAESLGDDFNHMRVDLYNPSEGTVLFGEMTVAHESGIGRFDPQEYDFEFGSHWDITNEEGDGYTHDNEI